MTKKRIAGITTEPNRLITRQQLSEHTGLSLRAIDTGTAERRIPYHRIGRSVRFDLGEVLAATKVEVAI
jgi:predicted DNA-binding transcriptional regulator AlpA